MRSIKVKSFLQDKTCTNFINKKMLKKIVLKKDFGNVRWEILGETQYASTLLKSICLLLRIFFKNKDYM